MSWTGVIRNLNTGQNTKVVDLNIRKERRERISRGRGEIGGKERRKEIEEEREF